jgi:DNA ligase-associated metallophosphoesterase
MSVLTQGAQCLKTAGEELWLLPTRALWWPRKATLAVADVHLGKGASFRAAGVPVPSGTTAANLQALDALLQASGTRHLLFLGDLFHSRIGLAASLPALRAWRARWPGLQITLVRGNHERHAGDPEAALGFEACDEPLADDGLRFFHHPQWNRPKPEQLLVAGHLHPVFALSHGRERLRLPCFWLRGNCLVLPAFGDFTGGHAMKKEAGDRIYLVSQEAVHALPAGSEEPE